MQTGTMLLVATARERPAGWDHGTWSGMRGLPAAMEHVFPQTHMQVCMVHMMHAHVPQRPAARRGEGRIPSGTLRGERRSGISCSEQNLTHALEPHGSAIQFYILPWKKMRRKQHSLSARPLSLLEKLNINKPGSYPRSSIVSLKSPPLILSFAC